MEISEEQVLGLRRLVQATSKHSQYQPLPDFMRNLVSLPRLNEHWRSPRPQLSLVRHVLKAQGPSQVVELGANTGFISLSLAFEFPLLSVVAVEANKLHAACIKEIADMFQLINIEVRDEASTPAELGQQYPSSALLDFNVLHHAGSDFLSGSVRSKHDWWEYAKTWLRSTGGFAGHLFQTGFNWGGRKDQALHDVDDVAGFTSRLIDAIGEDRVVEIYAISGESSQLEYVPTTIDSLDAQIAGAYARFGLVGEYFRRPVLLA